MKIQTLFFAIWLMMHMTAYATTAVNPLDQASHYLEQGHYFLALQETDTALQSAKTPQEYTQALSMKGNILLLMQRYQEAEKTLISAYDLAEEINLKAELANSLGVLYHEIRDKDKSNHYFSSGLIQASQNSMLILKIKLNQLRTEPEKAEVNQLEVLLTEILAVRSANERIRYALNLASIASTKKSAQPIVKSALEKAYRDSSQATNEQLRLEAMDSLAEFYEKQGQYQDALLLSEKAAVMASHIDADDLLINIEWRKGRIYQQEGRNQDSLVAFRKAVDLVQVLRKDIPITYEDGKSSFREKLEPIYLGYAHQLLKQSGQEQGQTKQLSLQLARQAIEHLKQSELEDFLGGRCLIAGIQRNELENIDVTAAILYPIILPDRLELLVSIGQVIHQTTIPVSAQHIQEAAVLLSDNLRNWILSPQSDGENYYQEVSEKLYQWIIAPIEAQLMNHAVTTLVIVPDGVLRLIPFSALFDGKQYLVEKLAISISPGLSLMTSSRSTASRTYQSLLAGLSRPGSVVEKLPESIISGILQTAVVNTKQRKSTVSRRMLSHHLRTTNPNTKAITKETTELIKKHPQTLREELSLPAVEVELANLEGTLKSTTLLNEQFTVSNFYQQVTNRPYEIIHIASHGLFSTDASNSFLMAYDDVIRLDDLKTFLKRDPNSQSSVQLLTLSACETAEGDDRAPLGFTGIALKADAQSALGSLWPISDEAASQLMTHFYQNLTKNLSKAESLRKAQLELLKNTNMSHPALWSPFILVGNWL